MVVRGRKARSRTVGSAGSGLCYLNVRIVPSTPGIVL